MELTIKNLKFTYSKISPLKYYILKQELAFTCKLLNLENDVNNNKSKLIYFEIKIKSGKSYSFYMHKFLEKINKISLNIK